jgi:hypothetical protein
VIFNPIKKRRNRKAKKSRKIIISDKSEIIYDPIKQVSIFEMGSCSTSCHQGTDGTDTKNEADAVMDDN